MSYGMMLDLTMDPMEETRIKKKFDKEIRDMSAKYHFTRIEIETLILIYYKINKDKGTKIWGITKKQLKEVLRNGFNMTDDTLLDRGFSVIETSANPLSTIISMDTWAALMSLFLRGTLEEKIYYCFNVYNIQGDGLIGRDTMFQLLRKALVSSGNDDDAEESAKDMIEMLIKKMDYDRDGKISFLDYKQSVLTQPMLLEFLGPCLPSRLAVHAFLNTVFTEVGRL